LISVGDKVFVDTGAWIALAERRDPFHQRAAGDWQALLEAGARFVTSTAVAIETFTFLDRKGSREMALRWKASLDEVDRLEVLGIASADLKEAWRFFDRKEFHKLSLVDATSFALMRRHRIRTAFAFDTHFSVAGFRYV
jgi:predicted nucleic acid-binding protein